MQLSKTPLTLKLAFCAVSCITCFTSMFAFVDQDTLNAQSKEAQLLSEKGKQYAGKTPRPDRTWFGWLLIRFLTHAQAWSDAESEDFTDSSLRMLSHNLPLNLYQTANWLVCWALGSVVNTAWLCTYLYKCTDFLLLENGKVWQSCIAYWSKDKCAHGETRTSFHRRGTEANS